MCRANPPFVFSETDQRRVPSFRPSHYSLSDGSPDPNPTRGRTFILTPQAQGLAAPRGGKQ